MKVGLYFGSFNPIHNGHTHLAEYLLHAGGLDEVWLVVSPNNPLKKRSDLWDEKLRLRLAELATEDINGLKVSDIETTLPLPSYTVNTLMALSERYPNNEFTLLMGSDNMSIFDRWRDWEYIVNNFPIMVYPRKGDDIEYLKRKYPKMKVIDGAPLLDISSTQIRNLLKEGKPISGLVNDKVEEKIASMRNEYSNVDKTEKIGM